MICIYCGRYSKHKPVDNPKACKQCATTLHREYVERAGNPKKLRRFMDKKELARITKVKKGELKDDFTNHFFSHFGFHDIPMPVDNSHKMDSTDTSVATPRPKNSPNEHIN